MRRTRHRERIETAERDFAVTPVVSCVAKDVEQLFPRLFVEFGVGRNVFQNTNKTRLWSSFMDRIGQAVVQGIKVFARRHCQHKLLPNQVQHILFAQCMSQIGIQKVVAHPLGRLLQVGHPMRPNRLNDICAHAPQYGLTRTGDGLAGS